MANTCSFRKVGTRFKESSFLLVCLFVVIVVVVAGDFRCTCKRLV